MLLSYNSDRPLKLGKRSTNAENDHQAIYVEHFGFLWKCFLWARNKARLPDSIMPSYSDVLFPTAACTKRAFVRLSTISLLTLSSGSAPISLHCG